jgi:protein FAM161A
MSWKPETNKNSVKMSLHDCSIFANFCTRTPINPRNRLPRPSYLKPQCVLDADKSKGPMKKKRRKKCPKVTPSPLLVKDNENFSTLMQFYDSIPDYNDVGHLSEVEFNIRLDTLRKKQLELGFRTLCLTDDVNQATELETVRPERPTRKGSAKSVRISSAESMHSPVQFLNEREDNTSKYFRQTLRMTTMSPCPDRYSSKSQLTVPEPFTMTTRDELKQSFENLTAYSVKGPRSPLHVREKTFKANPVPITSKFPMYQEILKDREHKSQLAKLDAAIELQSQMKPFSFDLRAPSRNRHCLARSFSSPNLFTSDMLEEQKPTFKATPYPKNLFNNNFYNKTCEENYFRDLKKKIRAEEMAKMAKLPPSMAKREESLASSSSKSSKKRRKKRKEPAAIKVTPPSDYITTCQHPYKLQTEKRARNSKSCNVCFLGVTVMHGWS